MPIRLKKIACVQCMEPVFTYGWILRTETTTKFQVAKRVKEQCMLGIMKRDRKRLERLDRKPKSQT